MTSFVLPSRPENLVHLHLPWLILPLLLGIFILIGVSTPFSPGEVALYAMVFVWNFGFALYFSLRWVRSIVILDDGFVRVRTGLGTKTLPGRGFQSVEDPGLFTRQLGILLVHTNSRFRLSWNFPCVEELELELRELNPHFHGRDWKGWGHHF